MTSMDDFNIRLFKALQEGGPAHPTSRRCRTSSVLLKHRNAAHKHPASRSNGQGQASQEEVAAFLKRRRME
jgi:hypothetical protein